MNDTKTAAAAPGLLRIQEVAAQIGTTPRSIRYWEEQGLLTPAARENLSAGRACSSGRAPI